MVQIEETTVVELGGERVGAGSVVLRGRFPLADGGEGEGPCGVLAFASGASIWVGEGSEFEAGGQRWRVLAVRKQPGELGEIAIEAAA